jgi:hypothetical protein
MTSSAAEVVAGQLQEIGIPFLLPPVSFCARGRRGPLLGGELDRATAWARMLVKGVESHRSARDGRSHS